MTLCIKDLKYFKSLIKLDVEYCGNLDFVNKIVYKGQNNIDRGLCNVPNSELIWHTHPEGFKAYPSPEDILKILKNSIIKTSIIFTSWGIWIMYYPYNISQFNEPDKYNHQKQRLQEINTQLYHSTEKGKTKTISKYINAVNEYIKILESRYAKFIIKLVLWEELNDVDIYCFQSK
jgi:hypothetical protein